MFLYVYLLTPSFSEDANQSVHLVASEGLEAYLPLADMVDISAELPRLHKRLLKMDGEYKGIKARLGSPKVGDLWIYCILLFPCVC